MPEESVTKVDQAIVPATPGWFVCTLSTEDTLYNEPIIAWEVICREVMVGDEEDLLPSVSRTAIPVLLISRHMPSSYVIRSPEDKYYDEYDGTCFSSADHAIRFLIEDRKREEKAAEEEHNKIVGAEG